MHGPFKNRTYLGKKLFFNFLGANFLAPKSSHRHEKQLVLGPDPIKNNFTQPLSAKEILDELEISKDDY